VSKSQDKRIVTQATEEQLARYILKNLGGYDPDVEEAKGDVEWLADILRMRRNVSNG